MKSRRLSRIFRPDGRVMIAAFDHGLIDGPIKGIEHPGETLTKIVAGGADAVLTSFGVAARFVEELAGVGLILRLDGGGTKLGKMGPGAQFHTVEAALRLGADAVVVSAFPGAAHEMDTLHTLATIIDEAHAWGLPVMAEMQPGGFDSGPEFCTAENVALSARVAAELGADWVKIPYAPEFQARDRRVLRARRHVGRREEEQRADDVGKHQDRGRGGRGRRGDRAQYLPGR